MESIQEYTSLEQSKLLLSLGLKKETANMSHQIINVLGQEHLVTAPDVWNSDSAITENTIPAWSLFRLIQLRYDVRKSVRLVEVDRNAPIDNLINAIKYQIKRGMFNKEFLEDGDIS